MARMINTDDCWLFAGYKNSLGYGQIFTYVGRESSYQYAHRVSYENLVGDIPEGLVIDHLCRVRHCINPDHLEAVTARVNTLRGEGVLVNTRKTHCPRGHEYTQENVQKFGSNNGRRCRQCALERHREYKKNNRDKVNSYLKEYRRRNKK